MGPGADKNAVRVPLCLFVCLSVCLPENRCMKDKNAALAESRGHKIIEVKQKLAAILEEARDSSEVIITWAARILSAVRLPSY